MNKELKSSLLLENQERRGARCKEAFGYKMAFGFNDPSKEVEEVRTNAGLFDLSFNGAIQISGAEGVQFLQGLVSNDVKTIANGKGVHAAFLTGHGKVRALCYILGVENKFLIINYPQTHEKVYQYIFPFSYAGDFQVEDVSQNHRILSLQGPSSLLILKESCFEPVPHLNEYEWVKTILAGQKVLVVKHSRTGEEGYDILIPESGLNDVWDFILLKGEFHSLKPIGLEAFNILRVEAGLPEYGIDIDESNMLLEVGIGDLVSFTKGCYTGQEAVAMATYRGHVNKKLSLSAFPQDVPIGAGYKLFSGGKEVGIASSVIKSTTLNKTLVLSCIKYGFFDIGTPIEVESNGRTYTGEIISSISNK